MKIFNDYLKDYKDSLKNIHAEEWLDVYFYRPLAYVIVKVFYNTSITPNGYSLLALFSGMAASYFFIQGNRDSFKFGSFFFLMFAVLDCADGMLARLKKNGSEFGRLIDGLVDYAVNAMVYITLAIGMKNYQSEYSFSTYWLVIIAGISKALHSISYDHYLTEFLSYEKGDGGFVVREIDEIKKKIEKYKSEKASFLKVLGLKMYLAYSSVQAGNQGRVLKFDPKEYCEKNLFAIKLWSLIGPSVHITILIIASLLNEPTLLFVFSIIFGNVWLLVMFLYQSKLNSELRIVDKIKGIA